MVLLCGSSIIIIIIIMIIIIIIVKITVKTIKFKIGLINQEIYCLPSLLETRLFILI